MRPLGFLRQLIQRLFPPKRKLIVVDGTNIAWLDTEQPKIKYLIQIRQILITMGMDPIIVVSSALFYQIDDREKLEKLIVEESNNYIQAPAKEYDDRFVLLIAHVFNALILSNDQYRDLMDEFPNFEVYRATVDLNSNDGSLRVSLPKKTPKKKLLKEKLGFGSKYNSKTVVIDGNNVLFSYKNQFGRPMVENLIFINEKLLENGFNPEIWIYFGNINKVNDPEKFKELIKKNIIQKVPMGRKSDEFILAIAEEKDALILSNDLYRSHREEYPWYEERRLSFSFVRGYPIIDFQVGETQKPELTDN